MATAGELRARAREAAKNLEKSKTEVNQEALNKANVDLYDATGNSVNDAGEEVEGFPLEMDARGTITVEVTEIAQVRRRLKEAGIDTDDDEDDVVVAKGKKQQEDAVEQNITDLIKEHRREVIGTPAVEDLDPAEKAEWVQEIANRQVIGAHLQKDSRTLTAEDRAEFAAKVGSDAVIEQVTGKPLSSFTPEELMTMRSNLRNAAYDARLERAKAAEAAKPAVDVAAAPDNGVATNPIDKAVREPVSPAPTAAPEAAPAAPEAAPATPDAPPAVPAGSTYLEQGTMSTADPNSPYNGQAVALYEDADGNLYAVAADGTVHPISQYYDSDGNPDDPRLVGDGGETTTTPASGTEEEEPPAEPGTDDGTEETEEEKKKREEKEKADKEAADKKAAEDKAAEEAGDEKEEPKEEEGTPLPDGEGASGRAPQEFLDSSLGREQAEREQDAIEQAETGGYTDPSEGDEGGTGSVIDPRAGTIAPGPIRTPGGGEPPAGDDGGLAITTYDLENLELKSRGGGAAGPEGSEGGGTAPPQDPHSPVPAGPQVGPGRGGVSVDTGPGAFGSGALEDTGVGFGTGAEAPTNTWAADSGRSADVDEPEEGPDETPGEGPGSVGGPIRWEGDTELVSDVGNLSLVDLELDVEVDADDLEDDVAGL